MSVLAVALFIALFALIVFPYQKVITDNLAKDATIRDRDARLADAGEKNGQLITLLGGQPEELTKIFPETSPTGGAVTYSVWKDHIAHSHAIQTVGVPEPGGKTPAPTPDAKYDDLAHYAQALESDIAYLYEQATLKDSAKQQAINDRVSMEHDIENIGNVAKGDKELPADIKGRVTFIQTAIMDMKNTVGTLQKTVQDLTAENTGLKDKVARADSIYQPIIADQNTKLDAANTKIKEQQATIDNQKSQIDSLKKQVADLTSEKQAVSGALTENYENVPAGKVFMIEGTGVDAKGAIDIGAKQLARAGMVFVVMHDGVQKGKIQLYQVTDNAGYFRILSISDPTNPIIKGDDVASPFYRGGKPVAQEFVLVGEFPEPLTKEKIADRIKEWGGTVADKISANTKYVIIGEGAIDDNTRNDIQFYNVQRITLATVKEFFGE